MNLALITKLLAISNGDVPIVRRLRKMLRANSGAGTHVVFDHHRLSQFARHVLADQIRRESMVDLIQR